MQQLSIDALRYYIRRCDLLHVTDTDNYRDAVAELARRETPTRNH